MSLFLKSASLIGLGGILAAVIIPDFVKSRTAVSLDLCLLNVMWIQVAKYEWARENHKLNQDEPTDTEVLEYLRKIKPKWNGRKRRIYSKLEEIPKCFLTDKDDYIIGAVGEPVRCPLAGCDVHNLSPDQINESIQFHYR